MHRELKLLDAAQTKRVLFVGEVIEDVYHYVRPLGRPTKDAIVSVELMSTEEFTGGVIAAADHANEFCQYVKVRTEGKPVRKIRFVEGAHIRKLFEYYDVGEHSHPLLSIDDHEFDTIVVTDYGHGMMTRALINELCQIDAFLAVNVQTNSGNYGFNLCTKYPSCDFLCVDEPEARLATQNRLGPIEHSIERLTDISPKVVVTMGKEGAIGIQDGKIHTCKAFTDTVVDTIGAGDAFFAVASLVAREADMPEILRIGNAAGALKAKIVGHRESIKKNDLIDLLSKNH